MSDFRILSDKVLASPQIGVDDIAAARAQGVTTIVNNRPEGESEDQVPGHAIEQAARAAGMTYHAIPITHAGFSLPQVEAFAQALETSEGRVLAYCRSGTRSTLLWALAEAKRGAEPAAIAEAAAGAGYDVGPVRAAMDAFAAQR